MKNEIQERFFYSQSIAKHIDRISEKGVNLFDMPISSESSATLMTEGSKLKTYWGQIRALQSFIKPSLSATFYVRTKQLSHFFNRNHGNGDGHVYYANCMELLEALMMECHNAGLLLRARDDAEDNEDD